MSSVHEIQAAVSQLSRQERLTSSELGNTPGSAIVDASASVA
jgi:hypothetical protein